MPEPTVPSTEPLSRPRVISLTTQAVAKGVSPLALLLVLPEPYAAWASIACAVFAGAGLAATAIPMPSDQSGKLWLLYRALNFIAMNWKYAANAAVVLKAARTPGQSAAALPMAGPGSVITIPQDTTK